MKIKEPKNSNYCANVVEIENILPLPNSDNLFHTTILGNNVVVDKNTKIGDVGLFFPVETQLSRQYLSANNLYRKPELNMDQTKKGYFEENGRIKCVKLRGNDSLGLFMPIESVLTLFPDSGKLDPNYKKIGMEYDTLNDIEICTKYIPKHTRTPGQGNAGDGDNGELELKIIEGQFKFHKDTTVIYKNLYRYNPNDVISVTYKIHGTSGISSRINCKRKLSKFEQFLKKWIKVKISDTQYDFVNSSRKKLMNAVLDTKELKYPRNKSIWEIADLSLRNFLDDGMTLYYEIAGYQPGGALTQNNFDYGCTFPKGLNADEFILGTHFRVFIYRITTTNIRGKVIEMPALQLQQWCKNRGLEGVPVLYYGYAKDFCPTLKTEELSESEVYDWRKRFLEKLKSQFNEKDCFMCSSKVPEEGCVVRIESEGIEAYKCKSDRFLEMETKELDKGTIDIESEN